jgi:diguanylate cyclase (GGDEF)-like protein
MEHLVVPTFVLDPDGRVMIWNRACERLTGLPASEVVGTREHWRGFYDQPRPCLADLVLQGASGEALYAELAQHNSDPRALTAENWCVMPQLGSRRYLAVDAGPIFSDTGELLAVVETLRDITIQHEAQVALKSLASVDALTGLRNRRSFDLKFDEECRRAQRTGMPVSLLMIDIDHFKGFNDHFGHQAGDDCLMQIASVLRGELLRPDDLAARYGGEEFGVILPMTPLEGAKVVAERLLAAVEGLLIPHPASPCGVVTLSVGAASAGSESLTPASLLASADAALYRAKRGAETASLWPMILLQRQRTSGGGSRRAGRAVSLPRPDSVNSFE